MTRRYTTTTCIRGHCLAASQALRARGHVVDLGRHTAVTQAIVVDPDLGTVIGASDPRKDGAPAGY